MDNRHVGGGRPDERRIMGYGGGGGGDHQRRNSPTGHYRGPPGSGGSGFSDHDDRRFNRGRLDRGHMGGGGGHSSYHDAHPAYNYQGGWEEVVAALLSRSRVLSFYLVCRGASSCYIPSLLLFGAC